MEAWEYLCKWLGQKLLFPAYCSDIEVFFSTSDFTEKVFKNISNFWCWHEWPLINKLQLSIWLVLDKLLTFVSAHSFCEGWITVILCSQTALNISLTNQRVQNSGAQNKEMGPYQSFSLFCAVCLLNEWSHLV